MIKEEGTWSVKVYSKIDSNAVYIASDDFHHDVMLRVSGDFADLNQKKAYEVEIEKRLNYYNHLLFQEQSVAVAARQYRASGSEAVSWPDTEERMDIIGSNGALGLHYENFTEYSEEYDSPYNKTTGEWLAPKCDDPTCEFCSNRPEKAF